MGMQVLQKDYGQKPDYSEYDLERERKDLKNFLSESGLWIPQNFFSEIRVGDVIDLYSNPPELRMLYCNSEFKKLCSYSPEQLASMPFPQLFWRSDEIQQKLVRKTAQVALLSQEAQPWGIENHELVENLHPRKRTFEIDLGWAAPCFNQETNERVAFVSCLRVSLIFEWSDFDPSAY